jgi:ADP-dependent NAD(P)H-hydrate dehydratase / NAD(P)H-hydrate epimerase
MTPKAEIPTVFAGKPVLTAAQAQSLDRQATEKRGIPAATLMENAGRAVADATETFLKEKLGRELTRSNIVVCCGRGANGGDGLVAARYLAQRGAAVSIFLCAPKKDAPYPELVQANLDRAREIGLLIAESGEQAGLREALAGADLAIDALLGTGSSGKPAGAVHHMIQELTRAKKPVVAVDVPSGLQPDTGHHSGVFVTAAVTVTFGWAKRGLLAVHAQKNVGELKIADIGYPANLHP